MKRKIYYCGYLASVKMLLQKSFVFAFVFILTLSIAVAGEQKTITGTVTDDSGESLPGVTVLVKGTTQGTVSDVDGNYSIVNVPNNATLVYSFVGMITKEVQVGTQSTIDVTMSTDAIGIEEVVAIGYGTKKKINLTGSVSVANKEQIESRPVGNVQQALQGLVPGLNISPTNAGGEPGADMGMSIRGLTSFEGSSSPYVLVDGVPMGINDINPNDIESISVLKDAASTSIYGARAAYGVILITTKKGQTGANVSYSFNYGVSSPTIWAPSAKGPDWAYALNDAAKNAGGTAPYPEEAIGRLLQNLEKPGSAPGMLPNASGTDWDIMNTGTKGVANDDIYGLLLRNSAPKVNHNLSLSGGNEDINYYISGSYYDEQGLLTFGDESYKRYNVDAKISGKVTSWMKFSFLAKYNNGKENFPWNQNYGRNWYMNWIGKLKPGTPAKYPGTDIWTQQTDVEVWKNVRELVNRNQYILSPRIVIEPVKNWVTNIELNYTANYTETTRYAKQFQWVRPSGDIEYNPANRSGTQYRNSLATTSYISPNIYSTYSMEFGEHDIQVLAGYQQEEHNYSDLYAEAFYMLSDAVPSISTSVGEKTVTDALGHWSTQSVFGRINYSFADKYLLEVNMRGDGSSRFEENERWGVFPSVSAGWIISQEDFFPSQDLVNLLKIRGSYGTLGNQNVANYLYVPTLPVRETDYWLFGGSRAWTVGAPNLTSVNLTWEQVATTDFGLDALFFDNRLGMTLGVYQSRTTNLVGPGEPLPAVLGTAVPKKNEGEIKTNGWELELSWKNRVNRDFSYEIKGILSDYKSTVVKYTNPTKLLNTYYDGQVLGEIWGLKTDGFYQSVGEVDNNPIDQSFVYSGRWNPGDFKYQDLTGDGKIDRGSNTKDDHGDLVVLGNSTPRYSYGITLGAKWKAFDASVFVQGIAKRDFAFTGTSASVFRGPANGPMHSNVRDEHLDYWRDETSALGANPNAYFPAPYSQYYAQNQKNYDYATDHLLQNASYIRLKNLQLGYSVPKNIAQKVRLKNARVYVSGENLLTITDLMFFDPEALGGRWYGAGDAYPLSKTWSVGVNLNF